MGYMGSFHGTLLIFVTLMVRNDVVWKEARTNSI